MSGVPVVAAFGPIVVRPAVGEVDGADSLDVLDAVFDGNHEPQRSSVFRREGLAVHFIAEECLGMQGAVCVETDVVVAIRRSHADIFGHDSGAVLRGKICETRSSPMNDLAPALD